MKENKEIKENSSKEFYKRYLQAAYFNNNILIINYGILYMCEIHYTVFMGDKFYLHGNYLFLPFKFENLKDFKKLIKNYDTNSEHDRKTLLKILDF